MMTHFRIPEDKFAEPITKIQNRLQVLLPGLNLTLPRNRLLKKSSCKR